MTVESLNDLLIAEATEYEFKSELEVKKPKSWLKTVSAFANGLGGSFFIGVEDDGAPVGLADIKETSDQISRLIKERITPLPEFNLKAYRLEDGKEILVLQIPHGEIPPYYYVADGTTTAFVRVGNESNPTSPQRLNELVMRGKNLTFDSLPTEYKLSDLTFTVFESSFKRIRKIALTEKDYISFGLCKPDGTLTYAGLMFSDECPLLQSRVFCTHWDGLDKSGGVDDAVDDKEFENDLISQLVSSHEFIKMNSKVRWKKMSDHRVNKPDYADRAVFEALANGLMHRDYTVIGSEVHVDMFDDRLEIYSPGGMPDGTLIQERNVEEVPSTRRNPIIAEIFHRLDFIERRGSGLKKIRNETVNLYGYTEAFAPEFKSTRTAFHVILKNMNYDSAMSRDLHGDLDGVTMQVTMQDERMASLLEYCSVPRTREEMQQHVDMANRDHFRKSILKPLLESGKLKMTIPDKPNSSNQKYVRA
ncbi:MAG: putative DNA binding domain-containing protein [Clostridiales Family XIII bacterium]|jgi:ATP-dependent DNA helicase RecG|nr:putative DNA binding domain-containing protein [Clostridiales Family XIII bacterium]